jgi:hypothetical protein
MAADLRAHGHVVASTCVGASAEPPVRLRGLGQAAPVRGGLQRPRRAGYGLIAKLRVVQPALAALPPGAASIELPQTWPVVAVVGAAGSGVAAA